MTPSSTRPQTSRHFRPVRMHDFADQHQCARDSSLDQNPDTAKALIEYLANPEFMEAYYNVAIYGPALQGLSESFAIFT